MLAWRAAPAMPPAAGERSSRDLTLDALLTAQRLAKAATRLVALHWGERWPFYYVSEYPKSGGTWLAKMVGDYLQVPFPRNSVFPIGCRAVILNHWHYDARFRRAAYLYRDGRDVLTSFFFHRLRVAQRSPQPASGRVRRHLTVLFGKDYEEQPIGSLLARFVDHELQRPSLGSRLSWNHHVTDWYAPRERPHVVYLRYEDLVTDAATTLAVTLERLTGEPAEPARVASTVEKFSMRAQTGRLPGQEDATSHIRKGIVGDWKNHFTRECAEIFHQHAGETLIRLGYEKDAGWVDRAFPG